MSHMPTAGSHSKEVAMNKQNPRQSKGGRSPVTSAIISLVLTAIAAAAYFYVVLPPINGRSYEFYVFLILICVAYLFFFSVLNSGGFKRQTTGPKIYFDGQLHVEMNTGYVDKSNSAPAIFTAVPLVLIAAFVVVCVVGSLISSPIFNAKAYYNLMQVETGDFAEDVAQISYNEIPMLDEESAIQLGKRALGSISSNTNLVSQFEVSYQYTQINYNKKPVRVSPLEYGDLIKWFNNRSAGLPGYIVVNMVTQEAQLVQLPEGMKYSDSDHFSRNLYRHLRFNFPTFLFGDTNFEIDEQGNPWWICSREVKTIGLFGGTDVRGAVLVNAITGECTYYEEVPSWVDRVYNAYLLVDQYNYHGALVNGFINSFLGQKAVTQSTDGYNYIALNDDVYMYTGVTSAGNDESNVGFILVNQRTKESKYYNITGAEEFSAMSSAEGAVQHLNYTSTFPILLNISDQPTYFMALKDSASLVKMYAMVNVSDYQITATGSTVASCQAAYEQLLIQNGITVIETVDESDVTEEDTFEHSGIIADLRTVVINGSTYYFITLEDGFSCIHQVTSLKDPFIFLNKKDTLSLECVEDTDQIRAVGFTYG